MERGEGYSITDVSASFSSNLNKTDKVEFGFGHVQKLSLCYKFFYKILLNILQCQL